MRHGGEARGPRSGAVGLCLVARECICAVCAHRTPHTAHRTPHTAHRTPPSEVVRAFFVEARKCVFFFCASYQPTTPRHAALQHRRCRGRHVRRVWLRRSRSTSSQLARSRAPAGPSARLKPRHPTHSESRALQRRTFCDKHAAARSGTNWRACATGRGVRGRCARCGHAGSGDSGRGMGFGGFAVELAFNINYVVTCDLHMTANFK